MEPVTSIALQQFLKKLGEQLHHPTKFYLLGGSALCLLGSPRETLDVDFSLEPLSASEETGEIIKFSNNFQANYAWTLNRCPWLNSFHYLQTQKSATASWGVMARWMSIFLISIPLR